MKAIFIAHNQALTEEVDEVFENLGIKGYTQWTEVKGSGSENGEPHMGNHTWPSLNHAILTMVDDALVDPLLSRLKALNDQVPNEGLRAFVWNIETMM
jgi:hypothetical protein